MAKAKEVKVTPEVAPKDPRQARWEKFLEAYAVKNPLKYAHKKAAGNFDKIPDSFIG